MHTGSRNTTEFLHLYNRLDEYMRTRLRPAKHESHHQLLIDMARVDPYFREKLPRLQAFRGLRNAIVHNPDSDYADPIAEPHAQIVEEYREVVRYTTEPPRALERAIGREHLYTVTWDTPLRECLETMRDQAFSLAPVLDGDRLEAVFLDFTLIRCFLETDGFAGGAPMRMRDLRPYLDLDGEKLGAIAYLRREATVREAEDLFAASFERREALRAIFITEDGTHASRLLGLLTAWDLLARPVETGLSEE